MFDDRVLSGMRPSGSLHLGNYLGALANWVRLQDDYECFYFSADWHVLTDDLSTGDVPQNIYLPFGQSFVAHMLSQPGREFRGDTLLSGMDLADDLDQILGRHTLEHVAASSRLKGTLDFNVAFKRCQHNDAGVGKFRTDGNHRVNSAHVGKSEIHECNVGLVIPKRLDGFAAAGCLGYQQHVRLTVDDGSDALA